MPSISTVLKALVAVAPLVSAVPADYMRRATPSVITEKAEPASASASAAAAPAAAAAGKLTDVDILNL